MVFDTNRRTQRPDQINMDCMYVRDMVGKYIENKWHQPYLVVVEHRHGRAWAYQIPSKGPNDEASWLLANVPLDWCNCGFKDVRVQLKTDQEPGTISLQSAAQNMRPKDAIPVISPMGESESNGRMETQYVEHTK